MSSAGPFAWLRPTIRWGERHPVLDGMVLGPIVLAGALAVRGLGLLNISFAVCLLIGAAATGLGAVMGLNRRRVLRKRAAAGAPDSPTARHLGFSSSTEPRPRLTWRIALPIAGFVLLVATISAVLLAVVLPRLAERM